MGFGFCFKIENNLTPTLSSAENTFRSACLVPGLCRSRLIVLVTAFGVEYAFTREFGVFKGGAYAAFLPEPSNVDLVYWHCSSHAAVGKDRVWWSQ